MGRYMTLALTEDQHDQLSDADRLSLRMLDVMWIDPPGYFCRAPQLRSTKIACTNFGVSLGLQSANVWPERVERINAFFENWRSGDESDREAITWVMACSAHF